MKYSRILATLATLALAATISGCGNDSSPTAPQTTLDTTPPPAPTALTVAFDSPSGHYLLEWAPSTAADFAKFGVYLYSPDPSRDNAYVLIGQPTDPRQELPIASTPTTYTLRVKAVDTSGNASAFSAPYATEVQPVLGGDPVEDGFKQPKPRGN